MAADAAAARARQIRLEVALWEAADSHVAMCGLTARWLTGDMRYYPDYDGPVDAETLPIAGVLADLNRAGYLTWGSEPAGRGDHAYYQGGDPWRCRASIIGWVADPALLEALRDACAVEGLWMITDGPGGGTYDPAIDGAYHTNEVGGLPDRVCEKVSRPGRDDLFSPHAGVLERAAWVEIVDPDWDAGDRLWTVLGGVAATLTGRSDAVDHPTLDGLLDLVAVGGAA